MKLHRYLGSVIGARRSANDVAQQLPTVDRRTPRTTTIVQKIMNEFVTMGLAEERPGPRGGKGWALTLKGQQLIDQASDTTSLTAKPQSVNLTGHAIGYARVSTHDQNPELQFDALEAAGCERIFEETASGAQRDRPQLTAALDYIRQGDTLVVWRLDRLARSLRQLIGTVEELDGRGIGLRSLTEAIDTTTPGGRLIFHIFGALAEFERGLIKERTMAGLDAARSRGRVLGRPRALDEEDLVAARAMLCDPSITMKQVAERLNVGAATLYRYFPGGRGQIDGEGSS